MACGLLHGLGQRVGANGAVGLPIGLPSDDDIAPARQGAKPGWQ